MATRLDPPPKVVVDIYGLVNLFDDKHPIVDVIEKDWPKWDGEFSEEEVLAKMKDRDLSHAIADTLFSSSQLVDSHQLFPFS